MTALRVTLRTLTVAALLCGITRESYAFVIDFETFTGPSTFAAAGNAQTLLIPTPIGNVTFSGGVILTGATNLPADETSIYGTAGNASNINVFPGSGFTNPITISFPTNIDNVFLDLINGNVQSVTYQLADNAGNSSTATVAPNSLSGSELISIPATGTVDAPDRPPGSAYRRPD